MTPSQVRITIAGLGAGSPGDITLGAWKALKSCSRILLRTEKHPVVEYLRQEGITFSTFDHVYEEELGFQEVYARIARAVLQEARHKPVLYAVPGHPLVAEESVRLIIAKAGQEGLKVEILPAVSFLDSLFTALRLDPTAGLQIVDGLRIEETPPALSGAVVITQVHSRLVASDVKLSLLKVYPPQHPVTVVRGAGIPDGERIETVPLFELDRLEWVDHLTSLYVPEAGVRYGISERGAYGGKKEDEEGAAEVEVIQVYEGNDDSCSCRFPLDPLVDIMARLRGAGGCPWDREQDHRSLRPYLIEEAYEVVEAISEGDMYKICEELGDLLLQIVFHAQIAAESRHFDINNVVAGITEKMIRRHPHVFASVKVQDSHDVVSVWEKIKAEERKENHPKSLLAGIPKFLPPMMRAMKLQKKAATIGFDWPDHRGGLEKTREELSELEAAISGGDPVQVEKELGDLIFSVINLARLLGVEPESALLGTSEKFIRRFKFIEKMARVAGRELRECTLPELDKWWEKAKKIEKKQKNIRKRFLIRRNCKNFRE